MFFAIPMLLVQAALLYFAIVGIKVTIERYQGSHGLIFIRDLLKYAALFVAVLITCIGLAGLLGMALTNKSVDYYGKLDAARWLSFIFIGIPTVAVLTRWFKRDFAKNPEAIHYPAWQVYLLAATSVTLLIWFIPLASTLKWLAGAPYHPRSLAQSIIAFIVWVVHIQLIRNHRSIIVNGHRFIGWFVGFTSVIIALINFVDFGISKWVGFTTSKYAFQEALILLVISLPLALFYWHDFDEKSSKIESRIYRTFAGMALPILFATIAATFVIHQFLSWNFDTHYQDRDTFFVDTPQQFGTVLILAPTLLYFRHLVKRSIAGLERDEITRIFQYLISGGGMVGIAIGTGAIVAGLFDVSDKDAILFGISILLTTLPTWYRQWRHCQFAMAIDFEGEHHAPVRRVYLYAMIGIPTLACIGAAVWVSYNVFRALLVDGFDRIAIATPAGILSGAGLVALYHLRVLSKERD